MKIIRQTTPDRSAPFAIVLEFGTVVREFERHDSAYEYLEHLRKENPLAARA